MPKVVLPMQNEGAQREKEPSIRLPFQIFNRFLLNGNFSVRSVCSVANGLKN